MSGASEPPRSSTDLARRQAELVASLVAGAPTPPGFAEPTLDAGRRALLRKRAGEVAHRWPRLAAAHGSGWMEAFAGWARSRPTAGALRDGWDFARAQVPPTAESPALREAAIELAIREAVWRYDGQRAPCRRRLPALRHAGGATVLQVAGRVRVLR